MKIGLCNGLVPSRQLVPNRQQAILTNSTDMHKYHMRTGYVKMHKTRAFLHIGETIWKGLQDFHHLDKYGSPVPHNRQTPQPPLMVYLHATHLPTSLHCCPIQSQQIGSTLRHKHQLRSNWMDKWLATHGRHGRNVISHTGYQSMSWVFLWNYHHWKFLLGDQLIMSWHCLNTINISIWYYCFF